MKPDEVKPTDYEQPVGYDTEGNPLYRHPTQKTISRPESMVATQAVHMARPTEIGKQFISDATKIKHDRSHRLYPYLNLSEGEYVVDVVRRHPIGLFLAYGASIFLITVAVSILFNYDIVVRALSLEGIVAEVSTMILPVVLFILLVCLVMSVAYYVYINNKFFLTNECIISHSQASLFARTEKSISLGGIEDASYTQTNILQQFVNYGSIRLSTVGDETSYKYTFVANPKHHVDMLDNAVEAYKNGRPVSGN
ncbi:hypothetical protein BH10PAT4_BH10PAT4_5170 [soil metagenome]